MKSQRMLIVELPLEICTMSWDPKGEKPGTKQFAKRVIARNRFEPAVG
jgi:hypothetical protein